VPYGFSDGGPGHCVWPTVEVGCAQ